MAFFKKKIRKEYIGMSEIETEIPYVLPIMEFQEESINYMLNSNKINKASS